MLLRDSADGAAFQNLHAFGLLDQTCTADLILRGTHEVLARDLHAAYLEGVKRSQKVPADDPSLVPWEELSDYTKEKNRRQADHIPVMLKAAGYRIAPLHNWDADEYRFSEEDLSIMAPIEHERWCQEKLSEGWKYGPEKDENQKTNPDLVKWDDLPPPEREKNKKYIQNLPKVLARAGFQIERQDSITKYKTHPTNI